MAQARCAQELQSKEKREQQLGKAPTGTPQCYFSGGWFRRESPEKACLHQSRVSARLTGLQPGEGYGFSAGKRDQPHSKRMADDLQGRL